jgi:hypothetical protein
MGGGGGKKGTPNGVGGVATSEMCDGKSVSILSLTQLLKH